MSKEHKIVVTRDNNDGADLIDIWPVNEPLLYEEGVWTGRGRGHTIDLDMYECAKPLIKAAFGFLSRKGSKQVLIIKKEKK